MLFSQFTGPTAFFIPPYMPRAFPVSDESSDNVLASRRRSVWQFAVPYLLTYLVLFVPGGT